MADHADRSERALRRFRSRVEGCPAALLELDSQLRITYANPALLRALGHTADALLGRSLTEWVHPDDFAALRESLPAGSWIRHRLRRADGSWTEVSGRAGSVTTADGESRTLLLLHDAGDLPDEDGERRRLEERLHLVLDATADGFWEYDPATGGAIWSDGMFRTLRADPARDPAGFETFIQCLHPDDREPVQKAMQGHVERGETYAVEARLDTPPGEPVWVLDQGQARRDERGRIERIYGTLSDITARKLAEEKRLASEQRFRLVAEAAREAIAELDAVGRSRYANPALLSTLERLPEEVLGKPFSDFIHEADRKIFDKDMEAAAGGQPAGPSVYRLCTAEGGTAWFEGRMASYRDNGSLCLVLTGRDISEQLELDRRRRQADARLREAQRLDSVALLAGGVAHDFNNLLAAIRGNAELASLEATDGEWAAPLREIASACDRAADLTRQLLACAGRDERELERVAVSEMVAEIVRLLRPSIRPGIRLELDLAPDLCLQKADPTKLREAILNLLTNALEFVDEGGRIRICTRHLEVTQDALDRCIVSHGLAPGSYLALEVSNTGPVIPPEHLPRIFEPFYTTRVQGRGLGLAVLLGVARSHGGTVQVESRDGSETTFRVLLPGPGPAVEGSAASAESAPSEAWQGAGDLVLVVDDESAVRQVFSRMLEHLGFTALQAESGGAGLRLIHQHRDRIRAAVIDLVMPDLDGTETADRMRAICPELPVLFCTGCGDLTGPSGPREDHRTRIMSKPFRLAELRESLRQLLEDADDPESGSAPGGS